jgi:ubiquinone/menaquinone biosynthesis C-methylase UbiE
MFLAKFPAYKKLSGARSRYIAQCVSRFFKPGEHILDFGCGNFFTSAELVKLKDPIQVTGIDVIRDQNMPENLPYGLDFIEYDGNKLPFSDSSYDAVLAASSLHHTPNPEYFLNEFSRVVKPGGSIVLVEEMYINPIDFVWIAGQDWILNKMKEGVPVPLEFRSLTHYLNEFKKRNWEVLCKDSLRPGFPWQHHFVFHLRNAD